jgi:iron complex transport system ATP-binding protein
MIETAVREQHELLAGVVYERHEAATCLRLDRPWQALSSAVLGGGRRHIRSLVHLQVPVDYDGASPAQDLREATRELVLAGPSIGLMTAVDLSKTQVFAAHAAGVAIRALITVGVGNASRAGSPTTYRPGTINTVLLVEGRLSDPAAVELVIVMSEAKAAALAEAGVRTTRGEVATGTSTDAVAILWRRAGGDREIRHGGSATELGMAAARIVSTAIAEGTRS